MNRRVVIYWHNGRSLGHTAGCAAVMRALRAESKELELVGLTGAYHGLDLLPPDAELVRLPSFRSYDTPGGAKIEPGTSEEVDSFIQRRSAAAQDILDWYQPDALLVDHLPWGWRGELTAVIESSIKTRKVLMWRGVLFDAQTTNEDYLANGRAEWIAHNYSAVVVHNDPRVFRLEDEYDIPPELVAKLAYSGYLAAPLVYGRDEARRRLGLPANDLVATVTMGGGQGAWDIWHVVLEAMRPLKFDLLRCVLGPYLEPKIRLRIEELSRDIPGYIAVDYEPDLMPWLAAADVVVSAAGANALGEILASRANAIVIPRQLREVEQSMHSACLADRGWIRRINLRNLTVTSMRTEVWSALREPIVPQDCVLLGGAAVTARKVLELLDRD